VPKRPVSGLYFAIRGIASDVRRDSLGIKIKNIRRNIENFGELLDYRILRWISPVMLQSFK
jgi:hypothetical protein